MNIRQQCELIEFSRISNDPREAIKRSVEILCKRICPIMMKIRHKLVAVRLELDNARYQEVFILCSSQIRKCFVSLFDVYKEEYYQQLILQDSRQCIFERLSWCVKKLLSLEEKLDNVTTSEDSLDNSILVTTMYFVNWIDHTFDVLGKLAEVIYKTEHNSIEQLDQWKCQVLECVKTLHVAIDELLLCAMTLCRYCLSTDQHVIKARCQVVLRETKSLLHDLIEGDMDTGVQVSIESLKLPIMPSNINILIDVLKDVLYVLETNTNTALLSLVIHCFSASMSPVDKLRHHFTNTNNTGCICLIGSKDDITEDCEFVKDFDLYNERLIQIGSFAVSCSSDQNRIASLRCGLASLEAIDPHLVPSLMVSSESHHATFLVNSWRKEVEEIRDNVFLIVDPAAFADKSKQMMHQKFLNLLKDDNYTNEDVCYVIDIGAVVHDFFNVYDKYEPEALTLYDKLKPLLANLDKVQMECKVVFNLINKESDLKYDVKINKTDKEVTKDQLLKRLKLLYTLITRINSVLHPNESDESLFGTHEEIPVKNATYVAKNIETKTYVNSPKRPVNNLTRSIFVRTVNTRTPAKICPLARLTKNLKIKDRDDLSFSVKLDTLFNLSPNDDKAPEMDRENSILYNFSAMKSKTSLRKELLYRRCIGKASEIPLSVIDGERDSIASERSFIDEATSLQITDVLNQMSGITNMFSSTRETRHDTIRNMPNESDGKQSNNIATISIDNRDTTISKHIWNIPVNASVVEMPIGEASAMESDMSRASDVNTLERLNDINVVQSRLNSLRYLTLEETSL